MAEFATYLNQRFIQRVGKFGFPTLMLKFPPSSFADFCHVLVLLSHPKSIMSPLYLTISKIMILYETLHTKVVEGLTSQVVPKVSWETLTR